jgi:hypothetical protein
MLGLNFFIIIKRYVPLSSTVYFLKNNISMQYASRSPFMFLKKTRKAVDAPSFKRLKDC